MIRALVTICFFNIFTSTSFANDWRQVDSDDLLLIETDYGTTVIELASRLTPHHVERMQNAVRAKIYDFKNFYRVIDGFVAQAGLNSEEDLPDFPEIKNENSWAIEKHEGAFVPWGGPDLYAPKVGHIDGFPVAQSTFLSQEWLLHCPGALAMARGNHPDSGGTEFYITLAPQRYLDRNLTVFGRVIDGMQFLQKLERGERAKNSGVIDPPDRADMIITMRLASQLPEGERPRYEVMEMGTQAFEGAKTARRVRTGEFFYRKPPEVLDICAFNTPARRISN